MTGDVVCTNGSSVPLNPVQRSYLVGRDPDLDLGGVSTHGYFEYAGVIPDLTLLRQALDRTVANHPALRCVIVNDQVQVLDDPPPFPLEVHDLRDLRCGQAAQALAKIRRERSTLVRPPEQWPLFGVALVLMRDEARLLVDLDGLTLDLSSLATVLEELGQRCVSPTLSVAPGVTASPIGVSERNREFWDSRLAELPPPPRVPLRCSPSVVGTTRFTARYSLLPQEEWRNAVRIARGAGLTPSGLALTLFAETVYRASQQQRFSLVIPVSLRPPEAPTATGQFSSFVPVAVEWTHSSLRQRGRALQQAMLAAVAHRAGAGPELLSRLGRLRRRHGSGGLPVVFTSAVGLPGKIAPTGWELVALASQTAGVWWDGQVTEVPEGLMIHWDTVDDVLGAERVDRMLADHLRLWKTFAEGGLDLNQPSPPTDQAHLSWTPLVAPQDGLETVLCAAWSHATQIWPIGRDDDLLASGATPAMAAEAALWTEGWFGFPLLSAADLALGASVAETAAALRLREPRLAEISELSLRAAQQAGSPIPPVVPQPPQASENDRSLFQCLSPEEG